MGEDVSLTEADVLGELRKQYVGEMVQGEGEFTVNDFILSMSEIGVRLTTSSAYRWLELKVAAGEITKRCVGRGSTAYYRKVTGT